MTSRTVERPGAFARLCGSAVGGRASAFGRTRLGGPASVLGLVALAASCGSDDGITSVDIPVTDSLTVVSGAGQRFPSGRRSPEPFRARATDAAGRPVGDAVVRFSLTGTLNGRLSQPTALTDAEGVAETYLLEAAPGTGEIVAESGSESVEFDVTVERAPGEIRFEPGSGAVGVPGLPHPDSVLAVQVFDTDGAPMDGVTVWFAASGTLSAFADTTDVQGRASTTLRRTGLGAGSGAVFAFIIGFEELTAAASRPVAPVAERVVLVSVEGLRADAIEKLAPSTLLALTAEGAHLRATTVLPTLTVPAHLSLWSGVSPEEHGVRNDSLRFTPQMASLNPIFRRARSSGFVSAAFMSQEGPLAGFGELLSCRLAFGLDSLHLVAPSGRAAVDEALVGLVNPELDLLFIHLPDPDSAGHEFGFTSSEYASSVLAVDGAIADLLSGIDLETTLLIVTSPHGGGGSFGDRLHGSGDLADTQVPLVFYGAGVKGGTVGTATILDVAPTLLWALGMAPPGHYEGRVLLESFQRTR